MYFKMQFIPVMAKLDFQQSWVSYDNLGIILILIQICLSNQIIKPLTNLKVIWIWIWNFFQYEEWILFWDLLKIWFNCVVKLLVFLKINLTLH